MANKVSNAKIDALIPDDLNANKGTEYGQHLIEESLGKFGAGRSILLDRNNRIIAGNKTVENAAALGLEDVIIIETTGKQIVAVKRTDIDLDSSHGREMAMADNATAKANIEWDDANIAAIKEQWEIDPADWGIPEPEVKDDEKEDEGKKVLSTMLYVECKTAEKLQLLFSELQDRGFDVKTKE